MLPYQGDLAMETSPWGRVVSPSRMTRSVPDPTIHLLNETATSIANPTRA